MKSATGTPSSRPLRLLSLDGGGIRGISELVILEEIMHRLGTAQNVSNPLPANYFDMICGTSTGGLIALLLGRLRLSVPEAIDKYRVLAKDVFSEKKIRGKDGTFKASNLEKAIKDTIEWKLGKGYADERMFVTGTESCKTFVCAVPARHINKQPTLLRTWRAKKNPGYNCFIWEAARATSAAPTFFKRIKIGDPGLEQEFIDAGIGCNNPVRYLIEEAKKEFGPERTVSCIVSIGTGKSKVAGFKAPNFFQKILPLDLIKVLANMATDSEAEASAMKAQFRNYPGLYHRLNVERGLEEISLEEWERLGEVKLHTETYLNDDIISREIDMIVNALAGKSSEAFSLNHLDSTTVVTDLTNYHFLYPAHQVLHYVAREGPLKAIHRQFQKPSDKMAPAVAILLGMGGCGKSQLALEYCRQGQTEKWFSAIFWLDASSPLTMARSFAAIANKLSKPNFSQLDAEGNIRYVLDEIGAWHIPWLLVFDNFDDPSSFRELRIQQYFPRSGYGSILFTSRHAVAKNLGFCLEVATMSETEALELLLKRSQAEETDRNKKEASKIVKRLGYHALAIDQAGAYILARDLDLGLYIKHYTERKEKVLNEVPDLWDYRRKLKEDQDMETKLTVFTTWELSIELISGSLVARKDKVHLLTIAGFLDGKEVSDDLFRGYSSKNTDWLVSCTKDGSWDAYEAQDIFRELQNLSLIQNTHIGEDETTISLHPLIQDWIKMRVDLETRRVFTRETMLILSAYLNSQDINLITLNKKQALQSHLEVVLQSESEYGIFEDNIKEAELLSAAQRFGWFLESQGRYRASKQMFQCALEGRTKLLGSEHPDTLKSFGMLAYVLDSDGKYDEAEPIYRQTLQLSQSVLGKEHPDTLTCMNNLATLLDNRGKLDEAEPLYRQTLQLREATLGKEHPNTLSSMNNLAMLLMSQGKLDEAEPLLQQTLQLRETTLGKEHPSTLLSMNNLALLLMSQGKLDEAEHMYRQTLQLREATLGKEHPDTLQSMNNLAVLLKDQGKLNEAEPLLRQSLQLREATLGKEHPDTLQSMNNLAVLLKSQGKLNEAEPLLRQTLQLSETTLGKEHPSTLLSMNDLAVLLMSQGKLDEAETMYQETLQFREKVLGKKHPQTLASIYNLADLLLQRGNFVEAIRLFREELDLCEVVYGPDREETLFSRRNLERVPESQKEKI